jgi:3-hydroxybutyryl-CoA dehydrogenase
MKDIQVVSVIGAGTMGAEIAALAALGGYRTRLHDASHEALDRAKAKLKALLPAMEAKRQLPAGSAATALERLTFDPQLDSALAETDFVIEAVFEDLDLKRQIFADLDRLAPAHAVLASNSSMLVSSRFADATRRPGQVINMHFFTPPLLSKVVEVVQGPHVADATAAATMVVTRRMGLEPVLLTKEAFGFVVNRVLGAVLTESLKIVEHGIATPEQVDLLITQALGHSLGPFRTLDLIGNDVARYVSLEKQRLTGRPSDGPSPLLEAKVAKGELGRKTGKGWYTYA